MKIYCKTESEMAFRGEGHKLKNLTIGQDVFRRGLATESKKTTLVRTLISMDLQPSISYTLYTLDSIYEKYKQ